MGRTVEQIRKDLANGGSVSFAEALRAPFKEPEKPKVNKSVPPVPQPEPPVLQWMRLTGRLPKPAARDEVIKQQTPLENIGLAPVFHEPDYSQPVRQVVDLMTGAVIEVTGEDDRRATGGFVSWGG